MSTFRDLVRMRSTVVANCSDLQRKLKSKLKIHMPELLKTFRSVSSPCASVECISIQKRYLPTRKMQSNSALTETGVKKAREVIHSKTQ